MASARKLKTVAATAAATLALSLPVAAGRAAEVEPETTPASGAVLEEAATPTEAAPVIQGATLSPPPLPKPSQGGKPSKPAANGGVAADGGKSEKETESPSSPGTGGADAGGTPDGATLIPSPDPSGAFTLPPLFPTSSCASTGVPPTLIPIYKRASAAYGLGPQGPAILAGINEIETGFGQNLGPSYAGAVGWMQFMPETWAAYGVDANQDGTADPNHPEDAIFSAANYLKASGMPEDTYGAIFAYNHADWYVADVLANAACYAEEVGGPGFDAAALGPQMEVFKCTAAKPWRARIPVVYMRAFEDAAARYELGKRGVWALAAVAHLESEFGEGMTKRELREIGPFGMDATEWETYAVDGDEDGRIRRADPVDAAATLARLIWSRGGLEPGLFTHNQAEWYVQVVLSEADRIGGECKVRYAEWAVAPLDTGTFAPGGQALLSGTVAVAPRSAPEVVKNVIAAANSISDTPYVWGGGHGSWYSYGYDCSGAVSFALRGGGLLNTPLVSGALASYGEPGPGKWITIYANATHVYMEVAGLRFDTGENLPGVSGPRWKTEPASYSNEFVVRHPTGY